ncbi:MAG: hypothetical protein WCA13_12735 [Terriglobales bacterium]
MTTQIPHFGQVTHGTQRDRPCENYTAIESFAGFMVVWHFFVYLLLAKTRDMRTLGLAWSLPHKH